MMLNEEDKKNLVELLYLITHYPEEYKKAKEELLKKGFMEEENADTETA